MQCPHCGHEPAAAQEPEMDDTSSLKAEILQELMAAMEGSAEMPLPPKKPEDEL